MQLRVFEPCEAKHPDGRQCERETGHGDEHWFTVWAVAENGENYPNHPVTWKDGA